MKKILSAVILLTSCLLLRAQTSDSIIIVTPGLSNEAEEAAEIFTIVETSPEFPGGQDSLMTYLRTNIKYPYLAMKTGIQGTVYVQFVIEPDGSLSNVKVLRAIGGGCDEEAQRVVKSMPKWLPGKQRGKPVRVQFNLPIRFILVDDAPIE